MGIEIKEIWGLSPGGAGVQLGVTHGSNPVSGEGSQGCAWAAEGAEARSGPAKGLAPP